MGVWTDSASGTHGAREFTEITVAIAGLNGLYGGTQSRLIHGGLRHHHPQLRAERRYLPARGAFVCEHTHGGGLRVFEARSGAHAEGVVDNQQHQTVAGKSWPCCD